MIDSPATRERRDRWVRAALDDVLTALAIDEWPHAVTVIAEAPGTPPVALTVDRFTNTVSRYVLVDRTALHDAGAAALVEIPDDPGSLLDPPDHDNRLWGDDT